MNNLSEINGNEIIDFLNSIDKELNDICINSGSFRFESQKIKYNKYYLYFSCDFNNWGGAQEVDDNVIYITENKVWLFLGEPIEGSGGEDVIDELLTDWLKTHKFATNNKETMLNLLKNEIFFDLNNIINDANEDISIFKSTKEIIAKLEKVITYDKS